jgi:hypothetical protein
LDDGNQRKSWEHDSTEACLFAASKGQDICLLTAKRLHCGQVFYSGLAVLPILDAMPWL